MCTTKLDISILHMFKLCSTSGKLREVNMVQLWGTVSRVWKTRCPGVHLSKTSYFVCGTSVSLCLLVQRISPLHIFLDKQYFQFCLAQKGQEELKVGQGKENTVLPTGQVHLNLLLLPPWLSLDNTSTWEVGDHIREVLDELLPPVFLSTFFNYKSLAS